MELPASDVDLLHGHIRCACRLEVLARKPGNVHPEASFSDLSCDDFLRSADAAAGPLAHAKEVGVGRAILQAVEATRHAVGRNTNLGICLLFAPLAAVPSHQRLVDGIDDVLERLTVDDAACVYRAIRLAAPAGLGRVDHQDVSGEPTETLRAVMSRARTRDRVAAQYATAFVDVLSTGMECLSSSCGTDWETDVIRLQLTLLAKFPDSLIARKCGPAMATEASERARGVLDAGGTETPDGRRALRNFDAWLRADGHCRNPGTTADLVAATVFAALREGAWQPRAATSECSS